MYRRVPSMSPVAVRLGFALEAGQAEVGDPEVAPAVDDQVRRLDVAVEHALLMGVLEGLGSLEAQPGGLPEVGRRRDGARRSPTSGRSRARARQAPALRVRGGRRPASTLMPVEAAPAWESGRAGGSVHAAELVDPLGEGRSVDELHGVIVDAALAADRVDRDDVGVVQIARPPGLRRGTGRSAGGRWRRRTGGPSGPHAGPANAARPRRRRPCRRGRARG